ncbi:MAG TPA: glycosyltransferase [Thermoleophilaceae bacterium]|jgi:glycosyltransferase involved in cell wall biosynthesis
MSLSDRDIVCLSNHFWDERRFRKQEFMARFARRNRVLYVEPSYSMARPPEAHLREVATNRHLVPRIEEREEGVHILKPPRALPKWNHPRVDRLTYSWYGRVVERAARRLGFRDPIVWVYWPSWYAGIGAIEHGELVLDLTDDLGGFSGDWRARTEYVDGCVRGLIRDSDLLVVTAKTLLDKYGSLARRAVHVPNGFDPGLFSPELLDGGPPAPLRDVPRPILGFTGTLFSFLDYDLLTRVAEVHADKSLVLVGPIEANMRETVERLVRLPNVFHVERQPQPAMPAYVAEFDVCLNPFRVDRVSHNVNPLKVYEYLAMGRPVVSTPMEALRVEELGGEIAFADGPEAFCAEIDRALGDEVQSGADRRRAAVAQYSWDRLFERIDEACGAALNGRAAAAARAES